MRSAEEIVTDLQYMEGQRSNLHKETIMDTKTIGKLSVQSQSRNKLEGQDEEGPPGTGTVTLKS